MAKTKNKYQRLLLETLGTRPVLFNPDLARALGSVSAGLFFSQLLYWWGKGRNPRMIYKTVEEFERETVLTRHQQLSAQKKCVGKGVLKVFRKGIPPKRHFQIDIEKTAILLDQMSEKRTKDMQDVHTQSLKSGRSNAEIAFEHLFDNWPDITESTFRDH
jgi:hypothetical protein